MHCTAVNFQMNPTDKWDAFIFPDLWVFFLDSNLWEKIRFYDKTPFLKVGKCYIWSWFCIAPPWHRYFFQMRFSSDTPIWTHYHVHVYAFFALHCFFQGGIAAHPQLHHSSQKCISWYHECSRCNHHLVMRECEMRRQGVF